MATIRFRVWLVICYANVFVLLSIVIVMAAGVWQGASPLPPLSTSGCDRCAWTMGVKVNIEVLSCTMIRWCSLHPLKSCWLLMRHKQGEGRRLLNLYYVVIKLEWHTKRECYSNFVSNIDRQILQFGALFLWQANCCLMYRGFPLSRRMGWVDNFIWQWVRLGRVSYLVSWAGRGKSTRGQLWEMLLPLRDRLQQAPTDGCNVTWCATTETPKIRIAVDASGSSHAKVVGNGVRGERCASPRGMMVPTTTQLCMYECVCGRGERQWQQKKK